MIKVLRKIINSFFVKYLILPSLILLIIFHYYTEYRKSGPEYPAICSQTFDYITACMKKIKKENLLGVQQYHDDFDGELLVDKFKVLLEPFKNMPYAPIYACETFNIMFKEHLAENNIDCS